SGRIYRAAGFLIRPRQELQEMIGGGWEGGEGKAARREWYGPSGRPNVRPIRGVEQASKDVRHPQGSERGSCASGHRFHPRAGSAGRGAGAGVGSPPSLGVPNRDTGRRKSQSPRTAGGFWLVVGRGGGAVSGHGGAGTSSGADGTGTVEATHASPRARALSVSGCVGEPKCHTPSTSRFSARSIVSPFQTQPYSA